MEEIVFDKSEDWENRVLCSDESCIGTIGSDGRCKECGKPYDGLLPATPSAGDVPTETKTNIAPDLLQEPEVRKDSGVEDSLPDEEWEKRVLCSDESCIGVIGSDGKCKECGKIPF
jgi:hypothetical protein